MKAIVGHIKIKRDKFAIIACAGMDDTLCLPDRYAGDFNDLQPGTRVEFDWRPGPRGQVADFVQIIR